MPRLSPPSLAQFDYGPISGLIPHLNYTARSGEQAGPERFLSFSPNRIGNIASVDVYVAPMPGAERSTGTVGLLSLTPGDTPPSNPADHHNLAVDAGTVGRLSGLTRRRLPPLPLLAAHLRKKAARLLVGRPSNVGKGGLRGYATEGNWTGKRRVSGACGGAKPDLPDAGSIEHVQGIVFFGTPERRSEWSWMNACGGR